MENIPLEKEFFVLKIGEKNINKRIYSNNLIQQWIDVLKNKEINGYKIEYAVKLDTDILHTDCIKDILFCGLVTDLKIDLENNLKAMAKFKIRGPQVDMIYSTGFLDDLVLVPKGLGKVTENIIYDYTLLGFNLIKREDSPFFNKEQ